MKAKIHDHTLLIFLFALAMIASPLSNWWSRLDLPWYAIFIPWALVIALAAVNQLRGSDRGD
ncbi:MAG: hypothetical protein V3U76_02955 [Granulosicoccus sp.]